MAETARQPSGHAEAMQAVDEVLAFAGIQGARTTIERLDDDAKGRRRIRVRVVREKTDWLYEVLIDRDGLMGIYRQA